MADKNPKREEELLISAPGEYEPSTELRQTDLAEGELDTVEECIRQHEQKE